MGKCMSARACELSFSRSNSKYSMVLATEMQVPILPETVQFENKMLPRKREICRLVGRGSHALEDIAEGSDEEPELRLV
ncbi:hypothetical protein SS50377_28537 [Spironucleus salmonicida]|uniref:Uncharacterized protein n=1 Tax=Spironucleus salmonicida TaxID=348837 RepID=V6LD75_9EUKA|nr:hypothetical protein SS50377_28537 [Spironucleus salmonicida]|eukprot:EST41631.1 Hypothetical protein SS50377_18987 [Spironucleus salmonicida]